MHQIRLTRVATSFRHGTFGALTIDGEAFCVTLEPYDYGNIKSHSCIPSGQYEVAPYDSPTFGSVYLVSNTPGRSQILFHAGNIQRHTKGCIILGSSYGKLAGDRAVLNSGATFRAFRARVNRFSLTIKEGY